MAENDKKDDDQEQEQEQELVMVGDGVEEGDQKKAPTVDDKKDEDGDDEGALSVGDERTGHGETEDDKRDRRRTENKSRRLRQKEARDRDRRELTFLRSRNEQVEKQMMEITRRQGVAETATIDQRISQLENAITSADDVYAKAIDAHEGKDAAEANNIRDQLKEQINGLKAYKERQKDTPDGQDVVDPSLVENVRLWHAKNNWFDFGRRDEDSAIAGAIDDMLVRDGWDPRLPEYYDELDKRVARRLPHLTKKGGTGNGAGDDDDDDSTRDDKPSVSGGPRFRVGGKERALKPNEVHISRDRREAMKEAGMWDDPVLRKKQLARYAEWDRDHASDNA